jgi:hypothetical protein
MTATPADVEGTQSGAQSSSGDGLATHPVSVRVVARRCLIASIMGWLLASCTSEQVYTKIQGDLALECQKYPDRRYEDCMERLSGPYDEYEESLAEKPAPEASR